IGKWDFWKIKKVISPQQIKRMRAIEFVAELTILLIEGPQDKKSAIDLYYFEYNRGFAKGPWVEGSFEGLSRMDREGIARDR
ncbi:MAG TPA: hypothetical protein VFQ43_16200, partial [Nitrososphaera sp.]|nr:hypothetical protein [Nitrososphaera sp.]